MFYCGEDTSIQGMGLLVNKYIAENIIEIGSKSTRLCYVIVRLNNIYRIRIVQAPTFSHNEKRGGNLL